MLVKITYGSDAACPFCRIGETRMRNAIAEMPALENAEIEMKAFNNLRWREVDRDSDLY